MFFWRKGLLSKFIIKLLLLLEIYYYLLLLLVNSSDTVDFEFELSQVWF